MTCICGACMAFTEYIYTLTIHSNFTYPFVWPSCRLVVVFAAPQPLSWPHHRMLYLCHLQQASFLISSPRSKHLDWLWSRLSLFYYQNARNQRARKQRPHRPPYVSSFPPFLTLQGILMRDPLQNHLPTLSSLISPPLKGKRKRPITHFDGIPLSAALPPPPTPSSPNAERRIISLRRVMGLYKTMSGVSISGQSQDSNSVKDTERDAYHFACHYMNKVSVCDVISSI